MAHRRFKRGRARDVGSMEIAMIGNLLRPIGHGHDFSAEGTL